MQTSVLRRSRMFSRGQMATAADVVGAGESAGCSSPKMTAGYSDKWPQDAQDNLGLLSAVSNDGKIYWFCLPKSSNSIADGPDYCE